MSGSMPLLVDNVQVQRRKLLQAQGSLHRKWDHFLLLAEHQAESHPLYSAFAGMITSEARWVKLFRQLLEKKVANLPASCRSYPAQYHTWCWCAPLARWAVYPEENSKVKAQRALDVLQQRMPAMTGNA